MSTGTHRHRRAFFVSPSVLSGATGGGMVSDRNLRSLRGVCDMVTALALERSGGDGDTVLLGCPTARWQTALLNACLIAGRLMPASIVRLIAAIRRERPDLVFLDSSLLGLMIPLVRLFARGTRVVSFFHNVEHDFFAEQARVDGWVYLINAVSAYVNEFLTMRFADVVMALTAEDSARLKQLYGRASDVLSPVALPDVVGEAGAAVAPSDGAGEHVLFVGSAFFANTAAAKFLIEEVAPRLARRSRRRVRIAGSCAKPEDWAGRIGANVEVLGRVDDLAPIYGAAAAVVAPLEHGAGMKVKVAEALMFGRPVIGTSLALQGYRDVSVRRHLIVAESADDLAAAIAAIDPTDIDLRREARADYVERFSLEGSIRTFAAACDRAFAAGVPAAPTTA